MQGANPGEFTYKTTLTMDMFTDYFNSQIYKFSPYKSLRVKHTPELGMHVIATKGIVRGTTIVEIPCRFVIGACKIT